MYRAVIICLISIGFVAAVPPLHYENRQIRHEPSQAVPPSVNREQNITQSPYAIPTYPAYPSYTTINPVEPERKLPVEKEAVAITTVTTPVNTTSVVELPPSVISMALPYLKTVAQFLVVILFSTSVLGLVCTYTPICSANFLKAGEVRALAHSYTTSPNLNNVGTLVAHAIEKYSALQG